jgi:WD40 repeat protein
MRALYRINLLWIIFIAGCASFSADRYPILRLNQAHPFGATALAYNRDGGMLATGGFFGEARIWSMPDGAALVSLPGNHEAVRGIAWIDDNTLVTATEDGTLSAWDLRTQQATRSITSVPLSVLVRIPNTHNLIVAHRDAYLRVYAYPSLAKVAERQLSAALRAVAVSRDGQTIAAATDDDQVLLLDTQLNITRMLTPAPRDVLSLRFSPDGKQLAAGTWFKVLLWDLASGKQTVRDTEHFGAIISIDYTPDGKDLVSLGRISDSSLRLTDVTTGQVLSRMAPLPLCGWMVQVSPDGHYVAAGSESGDVDVFDITAQKTR